MHLECAPRVLPAAASTQGLVTTDRGHAGMPFPVRLCLTGCLAGMLEI